MAGWLSVWQALALAHRGGIARRRRAVAVRTPPLCSRTCGPGAAHMYKRTPTRASEHASHTSRLFLAHFRPMPTANAEG